MKRIASLIKSRKSIAILALLLVFVVASNSMYSQILPKPYVNVTTVNSMQVWSAKRPLTTPTSVTGNTNPAEVMLTTEYRDGFFRTLEVVSKKASPLQKDMVSATIYDSLGRSPWHFLPYTSPTNDGAFKINPFAEQKTFDSSYFLGQNQTWFYGMTKYESSPMNRVQEEFSPGNSWVGTSSQPTEGARRSVKIKYYSGNANDGVIKWKVVEGGNGYFAAYVNDGAYGTNYLHKELMVDEHGMQSEIIMDNQNKILLKKVQNTSLPDQGVGRSHSGWLCTYYVYDERGNLRCIMQPEAVKSLTFTVGETLSTNVLAEQCFRFEYDGRNRVISKKAPGKGKQELVYDNRDRLVMSRDSSLQIQGYWLINKYDALNRPVRNYLSPNNFTRARNQDSCSNNINYPTVSSADLMQENYYDNYSWVNTQPGIGATLYTGDIWSAYFITSYNTAPDYAQQIAVDYSRVTGKLTGTKVRVFGTSTYLYSANFYDVKGQLIQTRSGNLSGGTGGYNIVTMQYDFEGKLLRKLHRSSKSTPVPKFTVELTKYAYDHAGRLTTVTKKISSGGADKVLISNTYDEAGNLKRRTLGSNIENQNFEYNIRGWNIGMNRKYIKGDSTNKFGYELAYDNDQNIITGTYPDRFFNGNIAATTWKSMGTGSAKSFTYSYDSVRRLKMANYWEYTGGSFNKFSGMDFSVFNLKYDLNGNILGMNQLGWKISSSQLIDSLIYTYASGSNRLLKVKDYVTDSIKLGDFKDGTNVDDDYTYDVNGNITSDKNKGISSILYNHLNLPYEIRFSGKGKITYTYDNLGTRLKKVVVDSTVSPVKTTTWQYIQNYVYKNDTLESFVHEAGRARYDTSETQGEATKYNYDYFLRDHLNNVRLVLTDQKDTVAYWPLSFEGATGSQDQIMQDRIWENKTGSSINIAGVRTSTTGNFGAGNGSYAMLVKKSTGAIGAAKLLKVMSGDRIHTQVDFYYSTANANNSGASGISSLVANLATALGASGQVSGVIKNGASTIVSSLSGNVPLTNLLNTPNSTSGTNNAPKAYLNVIFFDEQFRPDTSASKVFPVPYLVNTKGTISKMLANALTAQRNGYVYVYFSNESNESVYFDNFMLTHELGSLREETHYYPFGLAIAGLSSKALNPSYAQNRNLFNGGSELQSKEFSDGSGWEMYETPYRTYDPQIGRFHQLDALGEKLAMSSPYVFGGNNPVLWNDVTGLKPDKLNYTEDSKAQEGYGGGSSGGGWLQNPYKRESIYHMGEYEQFIYGLQVAMANGDGGSVTRNEWGGWDTQLYNNTWMLNEIVGANTQTGDYYNPDPPAVKDGKLSFSDANEHYRNGDGSPLTVDFTKIHLGDLSVESFKNVEPGKPLYWNLLTNGVWSEGLVYGTIELILEGNTVHANPNTYDFDMKPWSSHFIRNIETIIGSWYAGSGTPYDIYFNGTQQIPQYSPLPKFTYPSEKM